MRTLNSNQKLLKNNKLLILIGIIYVVLLLWRRETGIQAIGNSTYYLLEMAQILPVIFMLTVSIDVLVPKEWIVRRLGKASGIVGAGLALAFGSLSAGPIYAAFPIAKTLYKKGASLGNVVIILSAWAVIKVPMLANEAKFLGPKFMVVRWIFTVIFIIGMGLIMEKIGIVIEGEEEMNHQVLAVKTDYCIGCSGCQRALPELFAMKDGKALVIRENLSGITGNEHLENDLLKLVSRCPTKAISFEKGLN